MTNYSVTKAQLDELQSATHELLERHGALKKELAQYKEWHEATQRQLAKRYAQIHELTKVAKQVKDQNDFIESLVRHCRRGDRQLASAIRTRDKQLKDNKALRTILTFHKIEVDF